MNSMCSQKIIYNKSNTFIIWPNVSIQDVGIWELERGNGNVSLHPNNNKTFTFFNAVFSSGLEFDEDEEEIK